MESIIEKDMAHEKEILEKILAMSVKELVLYATGRNVSTEQFSIWVHIKELQFLEEILCGLHYTKEAKK